MAKKKLVKAKPAKAVTKSDKAGAVKATEIPEVKSKNIEVVETNTLKEGYLYIRILYDNFKHEHLYEAIEPELSEKEAKMLEDVRERLIATVDDGMRDASAEERADYLRGKVDKLMSRGILRTHKLLKEKIIYYILRDFIGYGKIAAIMEDPQIEDISCDGAGIPVYIYHRKYEGMRTNVIFKNDAELDNFVVTLAQRCGKHISTASPLLDATIPDGSRLQATLAREVTTRGSSFTIRRFRANPLTPPNLVQFKTFSPEMMAYCWLAVQNGESMLISGGTASGKTTSLNAILLFIPAEKKIVSIEDTREINIPHQNWIAGLTRGGFSGKSDVSGEVDMFTLMKAAMRQRPSYIIVGEVRGKEAFIVFQGMATGKATYSTIHADSVQAIIHRLENPPISLPRVLIAALNIVLLQASVKIGKKMGRRIKKIAEVVGLEAETQELVINTVFEWDPATDEFRYLGHSTVFDKIMKMRNISPRELQEDFKRRTELLKWFVSNDITDFREVSKVISSYYKDPEGTMKKVRGSSKGTETGAGAASTR